MSDNKFNAPWRWVPFHRFVDTYNIRDCKNQTINKNAICATDGATASSAEFAALIAAAPEMFEALEMLNNFMDELIKYDRERGTLDTSKVLIGGMIENIIAKAKGENHESNS